MTTANENELLTLADGAPDFYRMSEAALLNYCGADALKWAQAFCQIKERQGWSAEDIDVGLMLTWFANAIEESSHTRTQTSASPPEREAKLREALEQAAQIVMRWKADPAIAFEIRELAERMSTEALSPRDDGEAKSSDGGVEGHARTCDGPAVPSSDGLTQAGHSPERSERNRERKEAGVEPGPSEAPSTIPADVLAMKEALRLLAAEDERQAKLHDILETIREQIRLEVPPEHRPDGLFKNIQDAVYAMRGRTPLMNDAAITAAISRIDVSAGAADNVFARMADDGGMPQIDPSIQESVNIRTAAEIESERRALASSPVQDEAVAWLVDWEEGGEPVAQAYRSKEAAERAAVNIQSYRANYPAASITPLFTRPPAKADAGEIDVPGKTAGEPIAWIDPKELERAIAARGKRPLVGGLYRLHPSKEFDDDVALYTAPAAEQGVAVSADDLVNFIKDKAYTTFDDWEDDFARALLDKYSIRCVDDGREFKMSKAAHTAGPWKLDQRMPNAIFASDGPGSKVAATSAGHVFPDLSTEEAEANARLIAAAPDLLTACEAAEEWLSGWASAEPYLTMIRAAIAAAKGGKV